MTAKEEGLPNEGDLMGSSGHTYPPELKPSPFASSGHKPYCAKRLAWERSPYTLGALGADKAAAATSCSCTHVVNEPPALPSQLAGFKQRKVDKVYHALRAIYANEKTHLLTQSGIVKIVHGISGAPLPKNHSAAWFKKRAIRNPRPPAEDNRGLWYPCDVYGTPLLERLGLRAISDYAYISVQGRRVTSRWRLTEAGRCQLDIGAGGAHSALDAYDATAHLSDVIRYEYPSVHWWLEPSEPSTIYCDTRALDIVGRRFALEHMGYGDFECVVRVEGVSYGPHELIKKPPTVYFARDSEDADKTHAARVGRIHRLRASDQVTLCTVLNTISSS